ncbi:hypothetical protein CVU37_15075, partial [candidate division BRC1 bacterium HGW-BRC1-1]
MKGGLHVEGGGGEGGAGRAFDHLFDHGAHGGGGGEVAAEVVAVEAAQRAVASGTVFLEVG